MPVLLQADTLTSATVHTESFWSLLSKGGPLMIPLGLLFGAVIYFFTEKLLTIRKVAVWTPDFMEKIRADISSGNVASAKQIAQQTNHPIARMIAKGIQRIGKPIDSIEKSMQNIGKAELYMLEKNLNILSVISRIAPLFGFVGTIIGLVMLLKEFATITNPSVSQIADAMYVKLITSATGLLIGMLSYLAYSYLDTQINRIANEMDTAANDLIDVLQEPSRV
jgi:biopolymer transport protein ExbB